MKKNFLTPKESILMNTIELIGDMGLNALTIRQLAGRQGVTEAAIYRHFKSKEELLNAVLDYYSKFDTGIINTITSKKLKPLESILFYIKSFIEYYENYPAITAVTSSFDVLLHDPSFKTRVKQIINNRSDYISRIVAEGQVSGEIRSDMECSEISSLITGYIKDVIQKWRMDDCGRKLKIRIIQTLEKLLKAH